MDSGREIKKTANLFWANLPEEILLTVHDTSKHLKISYIKSYTPLQYRDQSRETSGDYSCIYLLGTQEQHLLGQHGIQEVITRSSAVGNRQFHIHYYWQLDLQIFVIVLTTTTDKI